MLFPNPTSCVNKMYSKSLLSTWNYMFGKFTKFTAYYSMKNGSTAQQADFKFSWHIPETEETYFSKQY